MSTCHYHPPCFVCSELCISVMKKQQSFGKRLTQPICWTHRCGKGLPKRIVRRKYEHKNNCCERHTVSPRCDRKLYRFFPNIVCCAFVHRATGTAITCDKMGISRGCETVPDNVDCSRTKYTDGWWHYLEKKPSFTGAVGPHAIGAKAPKRAIVGNSGCFIR